jgi:trimethylamine:corrinoid methyltransferase-like protein
MTDNRLTTWDETSCRRVHDAILAVLADPGVELLHEGARDLLRRAGARVDGTRVRFDAALVEHALQSAPRSFVVPSRGGHDDLVVEDGRVYYGTGGDCLYVHDLDTGERRRARLADVAAFAAVTERLPDLDYVMSMALPENVPETGIDVAVVAALLAATRKPLLICATCPPETLAELRDMAELAGAADSLMIYAMSSPPLKMDEKATGRLIKCAELGIPLIWSGSPGPGISAPCSRAGMVVELMADTLAGFVLHQTVRPGAPIVLGSLHTGLNMRTSAMTYCSPEIMAQQQASVELARFYGLPSFTYGGVSDSKDLDGQWTAEMAITLALAATSGGTLLHDVGYMESSFQGSFESIVLGDELARYVRAYLRGVPLDDLDFVVEEIRAVGPGGTHLTRPYTREQHRTFWQPTVIDEWMHDHWAEEGAKTLLDRLRERARELRELPPAFTLSDEVLGRLNESVRAAGGPVLAG